MKKPLAIIALLFLIFLSARIIHSGLDLFVWISLAIALCSYVFAITLNSQKKQSLLFVITIVASAYPLIQWIPTLTAGSSVADTTADSVESVNMSRFAEPKAIYSLNALVNAINENKGSGRHIMIYISADGCRYCKQFENNTLANRYIKNKLTQFTQYHVNATKKTTEMIKLLQQLQVKSFPTVIFLNEDGYQDVNLGFNGAIDPNDFDQYLNYALNNF